MAKPSSSQQTTTKVLLITTTVLVLIGLVPCFGWLNYFADLLCLALLIVGIVGLVSDRDAEGKAQNLGLHITAIIASLVLATVASVRLVLGCGVM